MTTTPQQKEDLTPMAGYLKEVSAGDTARVLDDVMYEYAHRALQYGEDGGLTGNEHNNMYYLRLLRNTMMEIAGCPLGGKT